MWTIKPNDFFDSSYYHSNSSSSSSVSEGLNPEESSIMSTEALLTELLVSQAIIDARNFQVLSFEELEGLQKEYIDISNQIKNISQNIELESCMRSISHTLSNVNLKNSRLSILDLRHQKKDIEKANTLDSLNKKHNDPSDMNSKLEHDINTVLHRLNHLVSKYTPYKNRSSSSPMELLAILDKELHKSKAVSNVDTSRERSILYVIKQKLTTEIQNIHLYQLRLQNNNEEQSIHRLRITELESRIGKLQSQSHHLMKKEKALSMELYQYKKEAMDLRMWNERDRSIEDQMNYTLNNQSKSKKTNNIESAYYEEQIESQSKQFKNSINEQRSLLQLKQDENNQMDMKYRQLSKAKQNLDGVLSQRSREVDDRDRSITRLHEEIQQEIRGKNNRQRTAIREVVATDRDKAALNHRELLWEEQKKTMEKEFDTLLVDFDRLTCDAMEFDTDRMKYDRKINDLNKNISELETNLMDEKAKTLGYSQGGKPTTDSLRKEFRLLVAEIKSTHQQRMNREAEEIRRLQSQIDELMAAKQSKYHNSQAYEHMSTQT
ncbi:hypothetical protein BDB01DRAFT_833327 [Pilobolus umbonatus]|nr:hypothetical protein BDB01DRAFT_833327 [Pilobolus umbonatus]